VLLLLYVLQRLVAALLLRPAKSEKSTKSGFSKERLTKIVFLRLMALQNFVLLNLYIPASCGGLCKIPKIRFNFRGMLLPRKEP
jgi:hypothetical protein